MDATRISDGRPVMLKRLVREEGPFELDINRRFSTEPLYSNPKNHCVHLLDVIELANDPPIMVHPLLRPFDNPPLQTFGEFVTFFAQICQVGSQFSLMANLNTQLTRGYNSCTKTMLHIGPLTVVISYVPSHF